MAEKKAHVRVVKPGEKPAGKPEPMSLKEAIESGTYLDVLLAQRRDIVKSLGEVQGPALAAMHRQLGIVSEKIEALNAAAEGEAERSGPREAGADDEFDASAV